MIIGQQPKIVCDFCEKEINTKKRHIETRDVADEGCSEIFLRGEKDETACCSVNNQHFCNLDCLFSNIRKELKCL